MKLESDKKLEKLESFLGRLNSKGECEKKICNELQRCYIFSYINFIQFILNVFIHFLVSGLQEATIAVTEKSVKEVMTVDDEIFNKFYRHTEDMAKITSRVEINDDFDAIFGVQSPR